MLIDKGPASIYYFFSLAGNNTVDKGINGFASLYLNKRYIWGRWSCKDINAVKLSPIADKVH